MSERVVFVRFVRIAAGECTMLLFDRETQGGISSHLDRHREQHRLAIVEDSFGVDSTNRVAQHPRYSATTEYERRHLPGNIVTADPFRRTVLLLSG